MEIKKGYAVFTLNNAVTGITSGGLIYDSFDFIQSHEKTFTTKEDAELYITNKMNEVALRNAHKNMRFIINEVYLFNEDSVFN